MSVRTQLVPAILLGALLTGCGRPSGGTAVSSVSFDETTGASTTPSLDENTSNLPTGGSPSTVTKADVSQLRITGRTHWHTSWPSSTSPTAPTPVPIPTPVVTVPAPLPTAPVMSTMPDAKCAPLANYDAATMNLLIQICQITNVERAKVALQALTLDGPLTQLAMAFAKDMSNRNYFSHTSLEGLSPFDRMSAAGISYRAAGENIAMGQKTPTDVMTAWMNSSGHRANILNSAFGKIGIGAYNLYWVQDFTN